MSHSSGKFISLGCGSFFFFWRKHGKEKIGKISCKVKERHMPAESEDIEDIYGAFGGISPYNEFGMWS